MLECRRCSSVRLVVLTRVRPADNYVFRCRDCGFLFSPPGAYKRVSAPTGENVSEKEATR